MLQGYEEFDVTKQYVCIVPGLEGHHARFRLMCERFKAGALVLQPGLDFPYDTVKQTAEKYAKVYYRLFISYLLKGSQGIQYALPL